MRNLVLHIGLPKCGSTFVQQTLHENEDLLADHGVLLPRAGLGGHMDYGRRHLLLTRNIAVFGPANDVVDALHREFEASSAETAIISHETLIESVTPEALHTAFARYDPVVIICCRHPLDYIESRYRQWVAFGVRSEIGPYGWSLGRTLRVTALIEEWRAKFGTERVRLLPVDLDGDRTTLAEDMLRLAGVDVPPPKPSADRNPRQSNEAVLFRFTVNRERFAYDRGGRRIANPGFSYGSNEGCLLSPRQIEKFSDTFLPSYERLVAAETGRPAPPSSYTSRPWDAQFFDRDVRAHATAIVRQAFAEPEE